MNQNIPQIGISGGSKWVPSAWAPLKFVILYIPPPIFFLIRHWA